MRKPFLVLGVVALVVGACGSTAVRVPGPTAGGAAPIPPYRYPTAAPTAAPYLAPTAGPSYAATAAPYVYPSNGYASAAPSAAGAYPYPTYPPYPPYATPTPYDGVTYTDPGVNPTIDTTQDHLSTFGLDVDTASYNLAQRYVADGNLPDPSSVRVEEFVNSFDQQYAPPQSGAFAIYADAGPSPFLDESETLLRIGIKARDVASAVRPPASLTFVIDVSGSMAREDRLELVKWALSVLVDQLRPDDRVGIVVFGSDARVLLPSTPASNRDQLLAAIAQLAPEGSTNTEAGLRLGYQLAREMYQEGGINRVVLASDGVANVGSTDADSILGEVREGAEPAIQLVTVGFGMGNYNDTLMEQLADKGDGFYAYVNTPDEARKLFVEDLTGTLDTVALDARVQVDFDPANVATYRLIGYENRAVADPSFRSDDVKGGAVGAGHAVTALYAVRLVPRGSGTRVATVSLRWVDPATTVTKEIASDIRTADVSRTFSIAAPTFELDALVAATAEHLRGSEVGSAYRLRDVVAAADELSNRLPSTDETRAFLTFLRNAAQLER